MRQLWARLLDWLLGPELPQEPELDEFSATGVFMPYVADALAGEK